MNNRKGIIGLTLAVIMVASVFSVLPVALAQPPTPTEDDNPIINVNASGITASLRVYGEYDEGPVSWMGGDRSQFIYRNWSDPFDPTALKKDSLTFNPAIILDGEYGQMSAGPYSNDIHVKKFLRLWYEPEHVYSKPTYKHPTIEVESTYMLIDAQDCIPTKGKANVTWFVFPIAEIPGQTGLGAFENTRGTPDKENLTSLVLVSGVTAPYGKTTNGTIRLQKTYDLAPGDTIQFLDHKLRYEYVVKRNGQEYAKVTMWYAGNIEDDTKVRLLLGQYDDGTPDDPHGITWFKRHNERYGEPDHANHVTWYAKFESSGPGVNATITVGKEISAGDTFYVNAVRYDVPAVEVIDTDGDRKADAFKYITLRTPLPKAPTSILVPDDGKASSQWIDTIAPNETIPLNPPFNMNHTMVDDINVVLWQPTANVDKWPIGDPSGTIGESYFPWAERYLTMQEEEIKKEVQCGKEVGKNWLNYFGVQPIDKNGNNKWIAYDPEERLIDVGPLKFCYIEEDIEPRYSTDLLEKLHEIFPSGSPPSENWTKLDIQTRPDQFTEFALPKLPDVETPYWNKTGDYLLVSSFLAPNSINRSHLNRTPPGIPRVAFAYDVEHEKDVLNRSAMGDAFDIYVNYYGNKTSVRVYGEHDTGPIRGYGPNGTYTYEDYQEPFNPAAIRKDSITFNPAIVQWDGDEYPMSAQSEDIDVKKYLRIWYEPEHVYSKPTYKHPTIEVESTYMLIDSQDKLPVGGSAWDTFFVFPIAANESTAQPGLELFENPGSDPDRQNVVTLAYVNGTVDEYNKTVYNNATIRIQKTYTLREDIDEVQFLDFKLKFKGTVEHNGTTYAKVQIIYVGNPTPETVANGAVLGKFGNDYKDPHQLTWFKRHGEKYETPSHPDVTWYAKFETYDPSNNKSEITVGKELRAGDVFYVDGVRYDVPAIEVYDINNDTFADKFKYITLRTPLPKGAGSEVPDDGIISSQWIVTIPPETAIPLNPPFNMEHDIVDDIDVVLWMPTKHVALWPFGDPNGVVGVTYFPWAERYLTMQHPEDEWQCGKNVGQAWKDFFDVAQIDNDHDGIWIAYDVDERIIGPYEPLKIYYFDEAIEPRYSTNLLEILNETVTGEEPPLENWTKYDVITRPDQYTEFVLPGDSARYNFTANRWETALHNDYLLTTSFLAPNAVNSTLRDYIHDYARAAFVFDAIDNTGIYVNEIVEVPPVPWNLNPSVNITVDPPAPTNVSGCGVVEVCTNGTTDDQWPLRIRVDWGDGTVSPEQVMPNNASPVCFTHKYMKSGTYVMTVTARDIYGATGTATHTVNVTSDCAILVFRQGWNAFSTPVNSTAKVNTLFGGFGWWDGQVWKYDAGTGWSTVPGTDTLDPKRGYFVYKSSPGTATIEITGTAASFDVSWGTTGDWNLVGVGYDPVSVSYWCYWWDPGTWSYIPTRNLQPGKGYFTKLI